MPTFKKRDNFFESEKAADIRQKLKNMTSSDLYNTVSTFTANSAQYPDNLIPFLDKHMNYLNAHPKLNADVYLANLRLMTLVR